MRNEEIRETITVVVAKSNAGRPARVFRQTGFCGHVRKGAIAVVVIKHDSAEAADQEVRPAVVGHVCDRRSHRPARIANAGLIGDVGKGAVMIVMVERAFRLLALRATIETLGAFVK